MSNSTLPISSTTGGLGASSTTPLASAQLNMQDFLQLMTTQLENQDPLNPMSDSDYFAQMAQLGTVEGMDTLNNSSQVQQAQSLMGETVVAANPNAAQTGGSPTVTGIVQGLSIQNGNYYLGIETANGQIVSVPMSSLQTVAQTTSLSGDSNLVGQTVTGTGVVNGQSAPVTGTVTGVSMVNGVPSVSVQVTKSQTVVIPVSSLTSISS